MADGPELTVQAVANLCSTTELEIKTLSRRGVLPRIKSDRLPLVETVQRYVEHIRRPLLTTEEAGPIIGKSAQWIRKLVGEGFIKKQPGGGVLKDDVFIGYIAFLVDEDRRSRRNMADNRVREARAREIELRIAQNEGRLIEIVDMEAAIDRVFGTLRSDLQGLPARVTRDLGLRKNIEQAVNDILARAAASAEEAASTVDEGGSDIEAEPTEDAG